MRKLIIPLLIFFISLQANSQKTDNSFTLVFYNVEDLYDTIDAPGFDDGEFTPESEKKWNTAKYTNKINELAKVLSSINEDELPEVIGLAEIENLNVLRDLLKTNYLRKGNYGIIHKDGPDRQGIDVALLYRKDEFKDVGQEITKVTFPFDSTLTSRDILHVYGKISDGQEMHFYVNHWKSRTGGQRETEPQRMYCAVALRRKIDMLLSKDSRARIVIMGDFNDDPTNKSIMNVMQASNKRRNLMTGEFYNLMYDKHNLGQTGSFRNQGSWYMPDQIIISYNLLTATEGYRCNYESGQVFKADWMMLVNNEVEAAPNSTFIGKNYSGGVSDHLPVVLMLTK